MSFIPYTINEQLIRFKIVISLETIINDRSTTYNVNLHDETIRIWVKKFCLIGLRA